MDTLSFSASVIGLISITSRTFSWFVAVKYGSLSLNYGPTVALFISTVFPNTATYHERVQRTILDGNDENALAFRQAVTDECNMTAVAGAIIAQVAITGLSLEGLSSSHWLARACLLFAVTSGCLTVYYCCVLQRTIGKLYQAQLIKDWLSLPPENGQTSGAKPTRRASLAAVFILSAPFNMVKASIFSLLISLAVYQGFTWTRGLDTSAGYDDSRNVFVTFMVGTGVCVLFFSLTFSFKTIEDLLRSRLGGSLKASLHGEETRPSHYLDDDLMHPRHNKDRSSAAEGLHAALEAAAQAHLHCAEAERRVADEYLRASQSGQKIEP